MISAVLITREKEYPQEILDSLPEFDEVIIETECPYIYRRYELAMQAKGDVIYVQDDDCIVDVSFLKQLYNDNLTNFISEGHQRVYNGTGITLIGWGALFPKTMLNFSRYLDKYGNSDLFKREADRVFTYLNQPFNTFVTEINHLERASNPDRMYNDGVHWNTLSQIKEQLKLINDR